MGLFEIDSEGNLQVSPGRVANIIVNNQHVNTIHSNPISAQFWTTPDSATYKRCPNANTIYQCIKFSKHEGPCGY